MNFKALYRTLEQNKYRVFSYEDIFCLYPNERKGNMKNLLHRWRKKGWICSLKRGLYELTYPKDFIIPDLYIAQRLYAPSYVSLETALSHYSIIPEVSMAVTSITTKPTRRFKNKHGLFIYRTVKTHLFTGYYIEKLNSFNIFIAEAEKALIDYLYFKTYRKKHSDFKEERLDKEAILRLNKKKISKYAKLYDLSLEGFYANL